MPISAYLSNAQNHNIYSLIMGQQDSRPKLSQKTSPRNINYNLSASKKTPPPRVVPHRARRRQCEGVLKLQSTPFKNCIQIETDQEVLFLESVELTLSQLLEGRLNTNKLFLAEDIDKLIEGVTFALAQLQSQGVTYKGIDPENIFYDQGSFKLLPNELIYLNSYQKLREGTTVLPSPELIIALRCGEEEVVEQDILQKSNVFTLGMVLLEVCTLLPSVECYDSENYDILDSVINERVLLVEEYYGQRIAKIVANMLDYDYTERMNLKDLSIWVNRQLSSSKAGTTASPHSETLQPTASYSVLASKVEKSTKMCPPSSGVEKSRSKLARNNSVYMNAAKQEEARQQRIKIYINDTVREEPPVRLLARGGDAPNRHYRIQTAEKPSLQRYMGANQSLNDSDTYKFNESLPLRPEPRQNHPYQASEDYRPPPSKKQNSFDRVLLDRETVTKRITKEPARPFRGQEQNREKVPLRQVGNQYYPNIEQILKKKPSIMTNIKGPGESASFARIKEDIQRNRRLIQQIKNNQTRS